MSRAPRNPLLTAPMARLLQRMQADAAAPDGYDGYLVHEGRRWVVGLDTVPGPAAQMLISLGALKPMDISGGGVTYYEITKEGERLLTDPAYVPALVSVQRQGAQGVVLHPDGRQELEFRSPRRSTP